MGNSSISDEHVFSVAPHFTTRAKNIYNQLFDKTGLGEESGHLKFKNMIQAIILDLIDRGYIAYSQENGVDTLRRISKEGLADYEFDFLYF